MDPEPTSGAAWSAERERAHVVRFCPALYFVAAPVITHIRIHQLYGGWVEGGEESGGASFVQHSDDPPAEIITELVESPAEPVAGGLSEAQSLRPAGVVHDRLAAVRYPDEYASYERVDWDRWVREVTAEAAAWAADDARWRLCRVMVDDDVYDGVQTDVDPQFSAAAFSLPEGRLNVAIERLGSTEHRLDYGQLRIVRSTDLDRVDWEYQPAEDEDD